VTDRTGTVDPVDTTAPAPEIIETSAPATVARDGRARFDRMLGLVLVAASLAFALVVQTVFFERWSWMLGDILYHRGVAYTVSGGDWQGSGPYQGLLSYSGGLYPMLLGGGTRLLNVEFDDLLGVASWLAALAWPLAALLLARRVWPSDWLSTGVFVALMTAAAPLSAATGDLWIDSVLPSGHNFAPAYPRDIALTLLLVALWAALSTNRRVRVFGAGAVLAVSTLFQPQVGGLGLLVIVAWWLWRASPARGWRAGAQDALGVIGIVVVLTSWWWIPRAVETIRARGLALPVHPARELVGLGPRDFLIGFGVAGLVGVIGMAFAWRHRFEPVGIFLIWLAVMVVPFFVLSVARDSGFVTSRRAWWLAAVPILALAVPVVVAAARATPRTLALVVVAALLIPSAPALAATFDTVRGVPWRSGVWAGEDISRWSGAIDDLRARVERDGDVLALTYDSMGAPAWSLSGSHVYSSYLHGVIKLGFDLERVTGLGYRERVRNLNVAFDSGQAGLCQLGRAAEADVFMLDVRDGLVGVYDQTPAAQYRTDPGDRTTASIDRAVGPGVRYRDVSGEDHLVLAPGGRVSVPWRGTDIRLVNIDVRGADRAGPMVEVRAGGEVVTVDAGRRTIGLPAGAPDGLEITALQPLVLRQVTGYAPVPGFDQADGPFVASRNGLCGRD